MNWTVTSTGNIPQWKTTSFYDNCIIVYTLKK